MPAIAVRQRQRVLLRGNGAVMQTSDFRRALALRPANPSRGGLTLWSARPANPPPLHHSPGWWTLAGAALGAATASIFTVVAFGREPTPEPAPAATALEIAAPAAMAAAPATQTGRATTDPPSTPEPTSVRTFLQPTHRPHAKPRLSAKKTGGPESTGSPSAGGAPSATPRPPSVTSVTPAPERRSATDPSSKDDFGGRE
jgi:hypothetical protein